MLALVVLVSCAFTGHARRVFDTAARSPSGRFAEFQEPVEPVHAAARLDTQTDAEVTANSMKAFAGLLLSIDPELAFQPVNLGGLFSRHHHSIAGHQIGERLPVMSSTMTDSQTDLSGVDDTAVDESTLKKRRSELLAQKQQAIEMDDFAAAGAAHKEIQSIEAKLEKSFKAAVAQQTKANSEQAQAAPKLTEEVVKNIDAFRKQHQIVVEGEDGEKVAPFYTYDETPFDPKIKGVFKQLGFENPTPIQAQSWPVVGMGRDIISIARTGSGKTIGFLMPALHKLMQADLHNLDDDPNTPVTVPEHLMGFIIGKGGSNLRYLSDVTGCNMDLRKSHNAMYVNGPPSKVRQAKRMLKPLLSDAGPKVLVMGPTRELVQQIETEALKWTNVTGYKCACLFGGMSKGPQYIQIERKPQFVFGTPGRINDLLDDRKLNLREVDFLVLDEADRMLDMGFEPQIRTIISQLPKSRQTLMFSATWPKEVQKLAAEFLRKPMQVNVGDRDTLNANKAITQKVMVMSEKQKKPELLFVIDAVNPDDMKAKEAMPKTIIFVSRKKDCDGIADALWKRGHYVDTLHGDVPQEDRNLAMNRFRSGETRILVATDVASRGLDVKDITCVINYDMPGQAEDYVHRIGRTGRGDNTGLAYSFFTPESARLSKDIIGILERAGQEVPQELMAMKDAKKSGGGGGSRRWK